MPDAVVEAVVPVRGLPAGKARLALLALGMDTYVAALDARLAPS